jgi:hypothetical protein
MGQEAQAEDGSSPEVGREEGLLELIPKPCPACSDISSMNSWVRSEIVDVSTVGDGQC